MSLANLDPALFYLVILPLAFLGVCAVGEWLIDLFWWED